MLYRVYPASADAPPAARGGPLFVASAYQGHGRHDNPDLYAALYLTRVPAAAIAEFVRRFRGSVLDDAKFVRADGTHVSIVTIDDEGLGRLPDLDDPGQLVARSIRPSGVATGDRTITQRLALRLFEEGIDGFAWWSTIEASWSNVTLFAERAAGKLALEGNPEPLTIDYPAVREAADAVGVTLAA